MSDCNNNIPYLDDFNARSCLITLSPIKKTRTTTTLSPLNTTASIAGPEFCFFGETRRIQHFFLFFFYHYDCEDREIPNILFLVSVLSAFAFRARPWLRLWPCLFNLQFLEEGPRAINGDPSYIDQGPKGKRLDWDSTPLLLYYHRELPQYLTYQALLSRLLLHLLYLPFSYSQFSS